MLVIAIGASTYFALRSFLSDRLDQQLDSTVTGSLNAAVQRRPRRAASPLHNPQDVYVAGIVTGANALAYSQSPNVKQLKLTAQRMSTGWHERRLARQRPSTTRDDLEFRVVTVAADRDDCADHAVPTATFR